MGAGAQEQPSIQKDINRTHLWGGSPTALLQQREDTPMETPGRWAATPREGPGTPRAPASASRSVLGELRISFQAGSYGSESRNQLPEQQASGLAEPPCGPLSAKGSSRDAAQRPPVGPEFTPPLPQLSGLKPRRDHSGGRSKEGLWSP